MTRHWGNNTSMDRICVTGLTTSIAGKTISMVFFKNCYGSSLSTSKTGLLGHRPLSSDYKLQLNQQSAGVL